MFTEVSAKQKFEILNVLLFIPDCNFGIFCLCDKALHMITILSRYCNLFPYPLINHYPDFLLDS